MRKRGSIEERMAKLREEIEQLVATEPKYPHTRRTLAGKRAALRVMESNQTNPEYCKS